LPWGRVSRCVETYNLSRGKHNVFLQEAMAAVKDCFSPAGWILAAGTIDRWGHEPRDGVCSRQDCREAALVDFHRYLMSGV
jgi:hypothetical protein